MSEFKKVEGLERHPLAEGSHPDLALYECTLKAGCRYEPELLGLDDRMQMFFFVNATGYVLRRTERGISKSRGFSFLTIRKKLFGSKRERKI